MRDMFEFFAKLFVCFGRELGPGKLKGGSVFEVKISLENLKGGLALKQLPDCKI